MQMNPGYRAMCAATLSFLVGCGAIPADESAPAEDEIGAIRQPLSCAATVKVYPVRGAHNNGWDAKCNSTSSHDCPIACTTSASVISNSDFAGKGAKKPHYGNDIFAARGTRVVAPTDGTIRIGFSDPSGGKVVYVQDGCGWWYYHAHLNTINPALYVGKTVTAGEYLGEVGNTGGAAGTQTHLHFSIYPNGVYTDGIDPYRLLKDVEPSACL